MNKQVIIIGGGISGLAAAWLLSREDDRLPRIDVTVLEASNTPGGKMDTLRRDDLIIEKGPNGFLDSKPQTLDLVRMLGMEDALLPAADTAQKRYLFSRGKLRRIPTSIPGFLFSGLLPFGERMRVFAEPFIGPGTDPDESVARFVDRRLGRGARLRLITPMVSGIYAGDPESLSMPAVFPTLFELERKYGGLVKGMFKRPKKGGGGPSGPSGRLTSFRGGTRTLVEAIAGRLGDRLKTGMQVRSISRRDDGLFEVGFSDSHGYARMTADCVVAAAPAYATSSIVENLDPELGGLLARIPYAPITVVAMAFRREDVPHALGGFGYLIPPVEGIRVLGTLWDSEVFEDRAPEGVVLMRTMLGGAIYPDLPFLPRDQQIGLAVESLKQTMGITAEPLDIEVFIHERGIPQFVLGYLDIKRQILARLKGIPGLFICNNSLWGVGLNDCVHGAFETESAVRNFLEYGGDNA